MMNKSDAVSMIEITEELAKEHTIDEVLIILSNLKEWAKIDEEVSAYELKKIAIGYKGEHLPKTVDYNSKVRKELLSLYASAAENGAYATTLLEAGLKAKRSYDALRDLAKVNKDCSVYGNIVKYAENPEWSDKWIDKLCFFEDYLYKHEKHGYDFMSVFTPQHNIGTFVEACMYLESGHDIKIPLDWLKDTYWRPYDAKHILYLYSSRPGIDWGTDIIKSWMTKHIIDEIDREKCVTKQECATVINKWKNVSPILEYALNSYYEQNDVPKSKRYDEYIMLKQRFGVDGDDLAQCIIHLGNIEDDVLKRNAYYHECVVKWDGLNDSNNNGVQANNSSSLFNAAAIMGGDY